MKILIADDHPIIRRGLKDLLNDEFAGVTIDEAESGATLLEKVRQQQWDLVLLDLTLPDKNGLDCLTDIRRHQPCLPVLVISVHTETQFALPALKAGASGYLTKDRAPEELLQAIKRVLNGGRYISSELAEQLATHALGDNVSKLHTRVSVRELQVLRAIGSGKSVSEIAASLLLSVKTISTYRARVLEKMNMKTNAELTAYCIRNDLGDLH
jgi:DNA-binding NarL/FixJ family response regulator